MTLKERIEHDLKDAMLGGDNQRVLTLRGLKSVILYEEVAKGQRDKGLSDEEVLVLLSREAKKRQESADLYVRGGDQSRADSELKEKAIIELYLPEQLSDQEIDEIVGAAIKESDIHLPQDFGKLMVLVKEKTKGSADGSRISASIKRNTQ